LKKLIKIVDLISKYYYNNISVQTLSYSVFKHTQGD